MGKLRAVPEKPDYQGHPWHRQAWDTDASFEAFVAYRDLGTGRKFKQAADVIRKDESLVRRWAAAHAWRERAVAYDNALDNDVYERMVSERNSVLERQARNSRIGQDIILAAWEKIDPTTIDPADLIKWFEVLTKIEREAYFPKDDKADVNVSQAVTVVVDPRVISPPTRPPGMSPRVIDADP